MESAQLEDLQTAIGSENTNLKRVEVPIVTVSGTYRKELLKKHKVFGSIASEAVFSRAHYSMAEAVRQAALNLKKTTHLVDPTNFVAVNDWSKIDFTEFVGQQLARHKPLKWLKDQVDTVVRNKLPITNAITPPLEKIIRGVSQPIIGMHYEAGNIAIRNGHKTIQVLTDPHVRPQYLDELSHETNQTIFAVFDESTKKDLFKKAKQLDKKLTPQQVVVTGPPVDPRISKLIRKKRVFSTAAPLHIAVTTGGLGTNLQEIKIALENIAPMLTHYPEKIRLFLYAGNHRDFRNFYEEFAQKHNIRIGNLDDEKARIRILYEDSIIDANENLIKYMFPWAHVIMTKPSGDMAYEAIAAGCVPLFLDPWGEWEENIQDRLVKLGVAHILNVSRARKFLSYAVKHNLLKKSHNKTKKLPEFYRSGAKNIVKLQQKIA